MKKRNQVKKSNAGRKSVYGQRQVSHTIALPPDDWEWLEQFADDNKKPDSDGTLVSLSRSGAVHTIILGARASEVIDAE